MAGCVFGYFADCTVVMPLFLRIANAFVSKCGRRNAEVQVTCKGVVPGGDVQGRSHMSGIVTGLALSEEPTFHNVFRLTVKTEVGQKIRSHFINLFPLITACTARPGLPLLPASSARPGLPLSAPANGLDDECHRRQPSPNSL